MRFDGSALLAGVGLSRSTEAEIAEPLHLFCEGLESTAQLTDGGREATDRYLHRLLDGRRRLDTHEPATAIEAPIFIVGPPRSGTTALHRLLTTDPQLRAPEGWEFLYPVRDPADPDGVDRHMTLAAEELGWPQSVATGIRQIHTYSARMPKECLSAMAFSFRTEEFISRYHVPAYTDWLATADMGPAYRLHRRVLQELQADVPTRWVLKSPVHLQGLALLSRTYPDARLVFTHRDPAAFLASVTSLIATLRSAFSEHVDAVAIGRYHLALYRRSLSELATTVATLAGSHRVVHVHHGDLVASPLEVLAEVYEGLGLDQSDAAQAAANESHDAPRDDAVGAHVYDRADFGFDDAEIDAAFSDYRAFMEACR